jgi:hypothetical protein
MTGPFIFTATNALKPGKVDDAKKRVPDLVGFIQANEGRLIAFNEYAHEDGRRWPYSIFLQSPRFP